MRGCRPPSCRPGGRFAAAAHLASAFTSPRLRGEGEEVPYQMRLPWLTTPTLRRWARHFPVPTSFDRHANRLQRPAMNQSVLTINGLDISLGAAIAAFTVAVVAVLVTVGIIATAPVRPRALENAGQL